MPGEVSGKADELFNDSICGSFTAMNPTAAITTTITTTKTTIDDFTWSNVSCYIYTLQLSRVQEILEYRVISDTHNFERIQYFDGYTDAKLKNIECNIVEI
jgi:hypothetical protein